MSKPEAEGISHALVNEFRDANLLVSRSKGLPFIQDETAQSHLFRIIDLCNTESLDDISTKAVCKRVILALLQCAGRLYEGKIHAKAAVELIESNHTRKLLDLGVKDVDFQNAHRQNKEKLRSDKIEGADVEHYSRRADLLSAVLINKARQLENQAMAIKHISSLCCFHGLALQNTFESPRIDEEFMFQNYVILSKTFSHREKLALVAFFPSTFQWEKQDPRGSLNKWDIFTSRAPSLPQAVINRKLSVITDGGVQLQLRPARTERQIKFQEACKEPEKVEPFFDLTQKKGLQFDNSAVLLPNSPESPIDRAVTLALNSPRESDHRTPPQKPEIRPVGIRIERGDASNHRKDWKDSLLSPSRDISDDDFSRLVADDESEDIFPLSLDSCNDTANRGPLGRTISANEEAEPMLPFLSKPYFNSTSIEDKRPSKLVASQWMRGRQQSRLSAISEAPSSGDK